jgi:hypothetical protein
LGVSGRSDRIIGPAALVPEIAHIASLPSGYQRRANDDQSSNKQADADKPPRVTDSRDSVPPVVAKSYLVRGRQSDLGRCIWSAACFVVCSQGSGSGIGRVNFPVTLIYGNAKLFGRLNRLFRIDLCTGWRRGAGRLVA